MIAIRTSVVLRDSLYYTQEISITLIGKLIQTDEQPFFQIYFERYEKYIIFYCRPRKLQQEKYSTKSNRPRLLPDISKRYGLQDSFTKKIG